MFKGHLMWCSQTWCIKIRDVKFHFFHDRGLINNNWSKTGCSNLANWWVAMSALSVLLASTASVNSLSCLLWSYAARCHILGWVFRFRKISFESNGQYFFGKWTYSNHTLECTSHWEEHTSQGPWSWRTNVISRYHVRQNETQSNTHRMQILLGADSHSCVNRLCSWSIITPASCHNAQHDREWSLVVAADLTSFGLMKLDVPALGCTEWHFFESGQNQILPDFKWDIRPKGIQ